MLELLVMNPIVMPPGPLESCLTTRQNCATAMPEPCARLQVVGCVSSRHGDVSLHRAAQVASAKQPRGKRIPPIVPPVANTVILRGPGAFMPPTGVLKAFTPLVPELTVVPPMPGLPAGSKCLRSVLFGGGADLPSLREMSFSVPNSQGA